ncbi:MAG: hypothetical protein CR986_00200 [Ignavibacteriae bacterium]|nr:MAG: hypothetical protein CR986_00200 [Ignavibacteriota bacterium]
MSQITEYQKAALNYKKHISLTANAGSGKTTVLAKRFVKILIDENVKIWNIVAITFTDKAASELYVKIAKELDTEIKNATGTLKHKLEHYRRSLVSAKISTIHSFCIDVLRDYAPQAGIDANFSTIDARTADEFLDQSIDKTIREALNENSAVVKKLMRIFGNKSILIDRLKVLFSKRKTIEKLSANFYAEDVKGISDKLENLFSENIKSLFGEKIESVITNLTAINAISIAEKSKEKNIEIERILNEIKSKQNAVDKLILLNELKENVLTKTNKTLPKTQYLSKKLYTENETLISNVNSNLKELLLIDISENYKDLNQNLALFGKEIIELYQEANNKYKNKKEQNAYLDFDDLMLLTQSLLKNEDVRKELTEKFKFIMIDEYQDTDEIQYNIFLPILNYLDANNLFVVGDEKQSIYGFREAEVELFNKTKNQIEKQSDDSGLLELPHSFRLAPKVALFTNFIFQKLFKEANPLFNEVNYNRLICAYQKEVKGKVELLISEKDDEIKEADIVSKKILQLVKLQKAYKYEDITILCNRRRYFLELEEAFAEYKIPYSIVDGKGFYQQQFVLDIYSYLSFLINPQNDLALVSILRGPFFNLSDVELTQISFEKTESFYGKLKQTKKFEYIIEQLEEHIKLAHIFSVNDLIRKICNDTNYWFFLASKKDGSQEIANLEKLIYQAIKIKEQGFNSLYDFINFLSEAINNLEDEGQADSSIQDDSVKIMTVHQSKGLEFKVVILFKTNQRPINENLKAKEISIDKNFGILAKLPYKENYFEEYQAAPIIGLYNYIQLKKSIAEYKRLLYVAVTRAEEYLIISAQLKKGKLEQNSFASFILNSINYSYGNKKINISDELTYMVLANEKFNLVDKKENVEISVDYKFEDEIENEIEVESLLENPKILLDEIKTVEQNEIISASKISLFLNCPKKYELTYNFGYGELTKHFRDNNSFEFNNKEDDEAIPPANTIGSVIHAILENEIEEENLEQEIESLINREEKVMLLNHSQKEKMKNEIKTMLSEFYKSDSYKYIRSFEKSYNEIEFYKREKDYFLYGIIDKLIITNKEIIIIDYKTDKISEANVKEKRETYINQLKFYAYILSFKYIYVKNYKLKLIFIRDEKFTITIELSKREIEDFGKVIKESVNKIRNKDFSEEKPGCKNMKYYLLE